MNSKIFLCFVSALAFIFGTDVQAYDPKYFDCPSSDVHSLPGLDDSLKAGQILFYTNHSAKSKAGECASERILDIIYGNDSDEGSVVKLKQDLGSYCAESAIACSLTCSGGELRINAEINRTQKYDIIFDETNYTATVEENAVVGSYAQLNKDLSVKVRNCSSGTNTINGYVGRYSLFKDTVTPFLWYAETNNKSLRVNASLDYEKDKSYHLIVEATMASISNKKLKGSATVDLFITVKDVDDNNPKFSVTPPDVYHLKVMEENATYVNVSTTPPIHAFDPDFGINQTISYSILAQEEDGLFGIGKYDGHITVSKKLDYEQKSKYTILIKAAQTDKPDTATAEATLEVDVVDIDDNLPEFTQEKYTCSINEHSSDESIICKITAIDKDTTPENRNFSYHIWPDSVSVCINHAGAIYVSNSTALDRELDNKLTFKVGTRTPSGKYGDNATVEITLVDINDNNPMFDKKTYYFNVNKSSTGDSVGVVHATDIDEGLNSHVTYSLLPGVASFTCSASVSSSNTFSINSTSGEIKFAAVGHCDKFVFSVQGCDNGVNRRCNHSTVEVTVNSDGKAKSVRQSVSVVEESPNNTYIAVLECNGDYHRYLYMGGPEFVIDSSTGMLKTNMILDRERNDSYNFLVNVTSGNQLLCVVNVTVKVIDINDNSPVFIGAPYKFDFPASPKDGDIVGTVKVSDRDISENGNVSFYLGRQSNQAFRIDKMSGNITITHAQLLTEDIIELYIIAMDNGTPPRQNYTIAYVTGSTSQNMVPVSTPLTVEYINKIKEQLERSVSNILSMAVKIGNVEEVMNKSSPYKSRIHIRTVQNSTISKAIFLSQVLAHYEDIRSLFYQASANTGTEPPKSGIGASEIGLIVMAAVILIGAILAIIIVHRQFSSQKRYKQLYDSLTKNSSIYESQEITVNIPDDDPECDSTVQSQDINSNDLTTTTDLSVTALNPAYTPDSDVSAIAGTGENVSGVPESEYTDVKTTPQESEHNNDKADDKSSTDEGTDASTPIVYANVNDKNHGYENINVVNASMEPVTEKKDGEETPVAKGNDLITFDSESSEGANEQMDGESEGKPANDDIDDEPKPDYNDKQVRFHSEVLDADENKLEPLKEKNEESVDEETTEEKEVDNADGRDEGMEQEGTLENSFSDGDKSDVNTDTFDGSENEESLHNSTDDTERLEEEIVAPGLPYDEHIQNEFFFGNIESTHF